MPVIHVHSLAGRKVEQKRAFVKKVTDAAVAELGCPAQNVKIVFHTLTKEDLAEGGVLRADRD